MKTWRYYTDRRCQGDQLPVRKVIAQSLILCVWLTVAWVCSFAQSKTSQEQVLEIPFDFYRNEIILQVKVNGKGPFNMLLDTGTDPSVIDLTTARELGLKLQPLDRRATGGGTEANLIYRTSLPVVEVGPLKAKNLETVAIDLSKMSARLGKTLHGVLGHSLLNGRIVQIDYANRIVRLYSRSPFSKAAAQSNTSKLTVLSFRYDDNVLVDDVFVNGKKVVANLDTGSDGGFKLTPAAVSYLGLEEEFDRARTTTAVGFNGLSENREGKVGNVTIGRISVDAPAVEFFGKGTGRDKKPWGLNIGNAFLKDFVVTIDYRSKLLILEKP
jgi:predicted aspartyl protease